MYAEFFALRELPFNNTPDPRFFFSTPDHEEAIASLIYAVKQRKGFVLLTGEVGAGKTLVSRLMLRHFGSSIAFATIHHSIHSPSDLIEAVCTEFELSVPPQATPTQFIRSLHDFLLARFSQNIPVVLVLDEAQNLPVAAFEQLRMIGNLESDDAKLLQIAIVGQPELQQTFESPQLRQLRQRIFRSFHLPALDRALTEGYIRYRLSVAGSRRNDLFSSSAIDRIYQFSGGLPRLINAVCDNAMLSAYSAGVATLDARLIDTVISQMMMPAQSDRASAGDGENLPRRQIHGDPRSTTVPVAADGGAVQGTASHGRGGLAASAFGRRSRPGVPWTPRTDPRVWASVEGLVRRVDVLEGKLEAAAIDDAAQRARQAAIKTTVQHAETLLHRFDRAMEDLCSREKKLLSLSGIIGNIAAEVAGLIDCVKSATNQLRQEGRSARKIQDQLTLQMERSCEAAEALWTSIQHSGRARMLVAEPLRSRGSFRESPPQPVGRDRFDSCTKANGERFHEILSRTRESLSALRRVAGVSPISPTLPASGASPKEFEEQSDQLRGAEVAGGDPAEALEGELHRLTQAIQRPTGGPESMVEQTEGSVVLSQGP